MVVREPRLAGGGWRVAGHREPPSGHVSTHSAATSSSSARVINARVVASSSKAASTAPSQTRTSTRRRSLDGDGWNQLRSWLRNRGRAARAETAREQLLRPSGHPVALLLVRHGLSCLAAAGGRRLIGHPRCCLDRRRGRAYVLLALCRRAR
jgi:hypothetical protein